MCVIIGLKDAGSEKFAVNKFAEKGCISCDEHLHCLKCESGLQVSEEDHRFCVKEHCRYPILNNDGLEVKCLDAKFSQDRVVPEFTAIEQDVDWRSWGIVSPVKNTGKCGGSQAFSVASATEASVAIKTGKMIDISEQYLLDCDILGKGCEGGW